MDHLVLVAVLINGGVSHIEQVNISISLLKIGKNILSNLIYYYFYIYIYIYIFAFHNTLVSHNMNLLYYNLKVKYIFIFIIYSII